MGAGRPPGSKNKKKLGITVDINGKAKHFAEMFIAAEHINGAEKLAEKILDKIRESKRRIVNKEKTNSLY